MITEKDLEKAWTAGRAHYGLDLTFEEWLKNYRDAKQKDFLCQHEVTTYRTLICTCCNECGEILDVLN